MFGHKWERAQATVVADQSAGSGRPGMHEYAVEVRKPSGEVLRSTITVPAAITLAAGAVISVEVEGKTGNVRFDPSSQRIGIRGVASAMMAAEAVRFQVAVDGGVASEVQAVGPGVSGPVQPGHPGPAGMSHPGPAGMSPMQQALLAAAQASGSGGPAEAVALPEVVRLVQTMRSGNKAQRAAAIAQLRELKSHPEALLAGMAGAAAGPAQPAGPAAPAAPDPFSQGNPAAPAASAPAFPASDPPAATFGAASFPASDPPASTFGAASSPAPSNPFSQGNPSAFSPVSPPAASTFGQGPGTFDPVGPVTPSSFDPVGGSATPSAFGPVSSFSAGSRSDQAERIARLQALRDQGLLSNADFEAQRQRIQNEF